MTVHPWLTYDLLMDITPWRTPDVPPKTGSSAKSKPTAQSWKKPITLNNEFQSISERKF